MTLLARDGTEITCRHSWHYETDGLPACRGNDMSPPCTGWTVACGAGLVPCERHADRRQDTVPASTVPASTVHKATVTVERRHDPEIDERDYWHVTVSDFDGTGTTVHRDYLAWAEGTDAMARPAGMLPHEAGIDLLGIVWTS